MNVKEAYETVNATLCELVGQEAVQMPTTGSDREKVQYLLDQYAARLKKEFWYYRIFRDNRKIPELICRYLGSMLTKDEERAEQGKFSRRATARR